jgi:hypothetical protein
MEDRSAMQSAFAVALLVVLFALPATVAAQPQPGAARTVTRTRLQVLFSALETQWSTAVQQKDTAALYRILDEAFQVWTAAPPGDPLPREEWEKRVFGRNLRSSELRQLAVRAVTPEVSVASFVLSEIFDQGGKLRTEDHFVVDVWVKTGDGDTWKCTDRYMSAVTGLPPLVSPKKHVKPTGKE